MAGKKIWKISTERGMSGGVENQKSPFIPSHYPTFYERAAPIPQVALRFDGLGGSAESDCSSRPARCHPVGSRLCPFVSPAASPPSPPSPSVCLIDSFDLWPFAAHPYPLPCVLCTFSTSLLMMAANSSSSHRRSASTFQPSCHISVPPAA